MVPGLEVGHDKLDGEALHRHRGKGRNLRFQPLDKGEGHIGKARVAPRASVAVVNDGVIRGLGHPTMPDGAREGACPVGVWPSRRRGRGGRGGCLDGNQVGGEQGGEAFWVCLIEHRSHLRIA